MRRSLLMAGAGLLGLLLLAACTAWLLYGRIGAWAIRERVIPKLEARLGRDVRVGSVDVSRGTAVLRDVVVRSVDAGAEPLVRIDRLEIVYNYGASWVGDVKLLEARIEGLHARAVRNADGSSELRALMKTLRGKKGGAMGGEPLGRSNRPKKLRLKGGSIELLDKATGRRVLAKIADGQADSGQNATLELAEVTVDSRAALRDLTITVDPTQPLRSAQVEIGDGEVALWPGMSLSGIEGTISQGDTADQLVVALSGSYGGSSETLWQAEGWLEPLSRRGQLALVAERFAFNRIAPVLEQQSAIVDFENTSVDAKLVIELAEGVADISGGLSLHNLNVEHPMLAQERLVNMSFDVKLAASLDTKAKHLVVESLSVVSKGVRYLLSGDYLLAGGIGDGGVARKEPRLALRAEVDKTDCHAVLQSIPAGFVPKLQGFQLRGPFSASIELVIDWENLDEETKLGGYIDLPKCRVLSPSSEFDAGRLLSSFDHQILVGPETYETVEIGMQSDNYAQIVDISPFFLNAVLTQEDSRFYDHNGFIVREFRSALVRNLEAGHFKYGASSISMQMVKNVFLYRNKTMSRKLQELFLTWYVERTLEKNRILEIYVNAIEYGPGVYGIVSAAEIYFGKHPRDIGPREAAFLAQLLPSPRRRYFQYCKDKLTRRTSAKMSRLLANMHSRNRLTADEYTEAQESTIDFNPQKVKELCRTPPNW